MKRIITTLLFSFIFYPIFSETLNDSSAYKLPAFYDDGIYYTIIPNKDDHIYYIDENFSRYINNRLNPNIYDTVYYVFLIKIKINKKGKIVKVCFLKGLDDDYVENDIMKILKEMKFTPAVNNNVPISFSCNLAIKIDFRYIW